MCRKLNGEEEEAQGRSEHGSWRILGSVMAVEQRPEAEAGGGQTIMERVCSAGNPDFFLKTRDVLKRGQVSSS